MTSRTTRALERAARRTPGGIALAIVAASLAACTGGGEDDAPPPARGVAIEGASDAPGDTAPAESEPATKPAPARIANVSVAPEVFNPASGQSVEVRYELGAAADVQIRVWGPNHELVREISSDAPREMGFRKDAWDGKDDRGRVVPDEAYYFTIEARNEVSEARYDPTASSGGEKVNPSDIHFRPVDDRITYVLPRPSRVLVRGGLEPGPSLTTIVNWSPRGRGRSSEPWLGKDRQGLRRYADDPSALVVVQAWALPHTSVIAFGSEDVSYRSRYESLPEGHPRRSPPRRSSVEGVLSTHWGQPVHLDKDPDVELMFPERKGEDIDPATPLVVRGPTIVRVDVVDEGLRSFVRDQKFELVSFLDGDRLAEAEQGRLPFNWSWDPTGLEPGDHWLTINLVTFRQHVGTASQRVRIAESAGGDAANGEPDEADGEGATEGGDER